MGWGLQAFHQQGAVKIPAVMAVPVFKNSRRFTFPPGKQIGQHKKRNIKLKIKILFPTNMFPTKPPATSHSRYPAGLYPRPSNCIQIVLVEMQFTEKCLKNDYFVLYYGLLVKNEISSD